MNGTFAHQTCVHQAQAQTTYFQGAHISCPYVVLVILDVCSSFVTLWMAGIIIVTVPRDNHNTTPDMVSKQKVQGV